MMNLENEFKRIKKKLLEINSDTWEYVLPYSQPKKKLVNSKENDIMEMKKYKVNYVVLIDDVKEAKSFHYPTRRYIEDEADFIRMENWMRKNLDYCVDNDFHISNFKLMSR